MQYIAVSLLCSKDETIIKQVSKKKVVVCLEHSRRSFVFLLSQLPRAFLSGVASSALLDVMT